MTFETKFELPSILFYLLTLGHMFTPPHMSMGPFSYNPSMLHHHHNAAAMAASAVAALGASFPTSFSAPPPPPLLYWPYPSPPISPNNYYSTLAANGGASHHLQSLPPMSNGHHHQSMMSQTSLPISPPMVLNTKNFNLHTISFTVSQIKIKFLWEDFEVITLIKLSCLLWVFTTLKKAKTLEDFKCTFLSRSAVNTE